MIDMNNAAQNKTEFTPLHPSLSHTGYAIHIHSDALNFLNNAIQDNYASHKLVKKLVSMRSNPRPWDSGMKKGVTDYRQLAIDGIWVNYFIGNGCVYIESITYNPSAKAKHEPAGLHKVELLQGRWIITETYLKEVNTAHGAVNGQNNNRATAAETIMPNQLLDAYKEDKIHEFTLFHNPTVSVFADTYESAKDKMGLTNSMTKSFSKLLHNTQRNQQNVKWVTHSQGGAIFSQAVKFHNKSIGSTLDKQTVFFQASANNMLITKRILKKAQVKLHKNGYNNSPIDGVPQVVGLNSITDVILKPSLTSLARLALAPLALMPGLLPLAFTSPRFSTHSTPYDGLGNYGKKVANESSKSLKRMIGKMV